MAVTEEKKGPAASKPEEKDKKKKGAEADKDADLSEEDLQLKNDLEMLVERVQDANAGVQKAAIVSISDQIRSATTSMTSVPKPLKFLRRHYETLKGAYDKVAASGNGPALSDVLSVLAMTSGKPGERETLKYKLQGGEKDVGTWGHEYVRTLAGEIGQEYEQRHEAEQPVDDLMALVEQIVPYHMKHNAEPEAVDLLLEVDRLDLLPPYTDEGNYARTCLYLSSCSAYLPEGDNIAVLKTGLEIYMKVGKYADAMRTALRINDLPLIASTFGDCKDPLQKKQLCYMLARQGVTLDLESGPAAIDDDELKEACTAILSNSRLSEYYLALARDLDVMEAKTPEDVYKMHLVEGRAPAGPAVDSARQNLASTFVNAFVNAGFGADKLMTAAPEAEAGTAESVHWIFKNKDHGKTSAAASLGMILQWDWEGGLMQIDKYLYSTDNHVLAGALLAVGIVNCGVQAEVDPAYALLEESVHKEDPTIRMGAIMGLGLAYAGTCKEEVQELLVPLVMDTETRMEVSCVAALSLGLVFASTCREECVQALLTALMTRPEHELSDTFVKLMCLGLGLLFLGKQDAVEATAEVTKTLNERVAKFCQVCVETCAYAGTGDVLQVQRLLAMVGEHSATEDPQPWQTAHQSAAVIGIALVAMCEDLGQSMAGRALEHLLQYGEPAVRRAVPLAVALLNVSNPGMAAMDMLSRLSHDSDIEVAQNAVMALGVIGAGTNNSRLAGMLRGLSSYYYKEPTLLFLVRVAQGLVHMGKGLLTLSPYHTDKQLLSPVALSGLLSVMYCCLDMKATIAGKYHFMLYYLATAVHPRMLMTLDEEGKMLPVPVRVGQAVDVVAQAGRPKTITGFQTHTTPVLLSAGERAELGTEKYLPMTPVLEGIVILKPNPDYVEKAHE